MSKIADSEANATSLDGLVNDNGLIPTLRNGPKPSYQYLVDGWNAQIQSSIFDLSKSRGFRVVGSFADGLTYELFNDVGIDTDGNSWVYVGSGAPNKVVTAGTNPVGNSDYRQVTYSDKNDIPTISALESSLLQEGEIVEVTYIELSKRVSAGKFEIISPAEATSRGLTVGYTITNGVFDGQAFEIANGNIAVVADGEFGLSQALFTESGIVPSGEPDTAESSQRLDALKLLSKPSTSIKNEVIPGVIRSVESVFRDTVNIKNYGAIDDYNGTSGTNCFPALQSILTEFPDYNVTIKFPNVGTGKYFFSGELFAEDVSGLFLDVDEGVEIYFDGTYIPLISKGVKVNREIKVRIIPLEYNFYLGRKTYGKPSDDLFKMTQSMGDVYKPDNINPSDGSMYLKRAQWPANSVVDDSQTTTSTTVNYGASSSEFNMALVDAKIGSEMQCYFDAGSYVGNVGVGVITTDGYSITFQNNSGGDITSGTISGVGSLVQTTKTPTFSTDAYRAIRSLLGIRIHSRRSYSLLINGIDYFKVDDTGSDILSAGFVVGFASSPTITLASPTMIKNKKSSGVRPLKICCLGDSTSDANVTPSAFDFMKQQLAGAAGIQVTTLTNLAVSGETSGQQLERLRAIDMTWYDYLLCDVGVNDIQGNLGANGLNDNVSDIIDIGNAAGAVTIVGLPTMWYERSDAAPYDQLGQNTVNSNVGAQYRGSLIQTIASKGALLNMSTIQDLGVADPSLLGNETVDPVLMDNIHPTNFGRQLRGFGWAKSIIGHCMPTSKDNSQSEIAPSSFMSGDAGSTERPFVSIKDGVATISGTISVATISDGYGVMRLPRGLRPTSDKTIICSTALSGGVPAGSCTVQLDTSGVMSIYSVPELTAFIYIDFTFNI